MRDLIFVGYIALIMLMAFKRPFLFTLVYAYVDIVSPQRLSYFLLNSIPLSLILFALAFLGFMVSDDKKDVRVSPRWFLLILLLGYCGYTTSVAAEPVAALDKWNWVWKALVFAAFVSFSATQMLMDKKPKPTRTLPGTAGQIGAGTTIGFLSGLVGAGGGFVSVPFMTWCNVAIHNAVATSAALGFPIALANALGYIVSGQGVTGLPTGSLGYVFLPALLVIAIASVLMAPLGVKAAHALPVKSLKRVFASILYVLAAYMLYKGLAA